MLTSGEMRDTLRAIAEIDRCARRVSQVRTEIEDVSSRDNDTFRVSNQFA
ncbi:MAG: hypothetical protein J07HQX50_01315 [Haloquadratum sp. J07HQX50]|jgi:hypothetical protein|nr:MAG: hypothetical protein J07HQX50_01315 [Haloquadratum sp. J07HQX50]